jgi:PEP-CTERM motif
MKKHITLTSMVVVLVSAVITLPAIAGTIYDNGTPITFDNFLINTMNVTSNSVHCSNRCTPTDLTFWAVGPIGVPLGNTLAWSFTSGEFTGVGYNSGVSPIPTSLPCVDQGGLQQCVITVALNGTLSQPANSWLNLTTNGLATGWAISAGPSLASTCQLNPVTGRCGPTVFNIPSEAFSLSGTTVPEPSSMMLLGSGVLGLAGVLRRKLKL